MNLADLFSSERGAQSRLAAKTEIPAPMLSQWASGSRPIPIERCTPIEVATGGKVRRWDLRPDDWHLIWPELIRAKGAPSVPAAPPKSDGGHTERAQASQRTRKPRNPDRSNTHREGR
jgi:DNA-binding transcriptional regulator YdaS (Cro superfamily)